MSQRSNNDHCERNVSEDHFGDVNEMAIQYYAHELNIDATVRIYIGLQRSAVMSNKLDVLHYFILSPLLASEKNIPC